MKTEAYEKEIIGGLVDDPNNYHRLGGLTSEAFVKYRSTFSSVCNLIRKGHGAIIDADFGYSGRFDEAVRVVLDQHLKRKLSNSLEQIKVACANGVTIVDLQKELLNTYLTCSDGRIAEERTGEEIQPEFIESLISRKQNAEKGLPASGITSGIVPYDDMSGGLYEKELVVIGGRPAVGKTMIMCFMAVQIAKSKVPVGLWSMEMSEAQLYERMIVNLTGIDGERLRKGKYTARDEKRIEETTTILNALPLIYYDKPSNINTIISSMHIARKKHGIKVFFVDYLQRIKGEEKYDLHEQINRMAIKFKTFAQTTGVNIVLFSQLNRMAIDEPGLDNLKGSGGIEQEADAVILLSKGNHNKMNFRVAKNRNGRTGDLRLDFSPEYCSFS